MIASVDESKIRPAATFVKVRSLPTEPILTVELGVVPANVYVLPFSVALFVATVATVSELVPNATEPWCVAFAFWPRATAAVVVACDETPNAIEATPAAFALLPKAIAELPAALAFLPTEVDHIPPALAELPKAVDCVPEAFAL
ncbi:hypothetical protein LGIHADK_03105 [Mannheimia haemolytica]